MFAFDKTTGAPKTGDAGNITAYVSKDHASVTVLGDTSATEMDATNAPGWYVFDLTQGETNADFCLFSAKSSTSNIVIVARPIFTVPPNFTALSITSAGLVAIASAVKKNQALAKYPFLMTDSTTHAPKTGLTVEVAISKDGGSFVTATNSPATETANGWYYIDMTQAEMNATTIALRMTATAADDLPVCLITQP